MNIREVLHVVGTLLLWLAGSMLPSTVFGLREGNAMGWLLSVGVTGGIGAVLWALTPRKISINPREGLVTVGLGWLAVVLAGSLPFIFVGVTTFEKAFFESVSGFTTTGATIFPVIEELPQSILLWRSVSHWLGGMGIIVLGVAILPTLGVGGAQLFHAEVPGVAGDRLTPRIATTARLLWVVYAMFTSVLALLYLALGMTPFDAFNHAFSTLATGGFSTHTASMAYFSPAIQWVTVVFMGIAGTNFALHYQMLTGRFGAMVHDYEWRWFAGILAGATGVAFLSLIIAGTDVHWLETFRHALFNVTAVVTTTGFATDDFASWPSLVQMMLFLLMFVGAMGGSTGGGFKIVRAVVVFKQAANEIRKVLHPSAIVVTRIGQVAVKSEVLLKVMAFLTLYVGTHAVGSLVLASQGYDLVTSTSAALAAMSSIGPGLGAVGPVSHYGDLTMTSHFTLSALMLLGRLEFYTLLVLFIPETWSRWGGER
jgi:trk system potassium uptake protein TrkH